MGWTYKDIEPNNTHHSLSTSEVEDANLVLAVIWLEQNNDCVDDLRRRLEAPEFADKIATEQYMLLLRRWGVKSKIKQISDRYQQLRDYCCIQRGNTPVFDWRNDRITAGEIRDNDLKTLVSKDLNFLSDMRDALRPIYESRSDSSLDTPDYKLVCETYEIALSVSRSMEHITAPAQIAVPTSGPLAGDDSDLSDVDDPSNRSSVMPDAS